MNFKEIARVCRKGEHERAEKLLRKYLEKKPHVAAAWHYLGLAVLMQDDQSANRKRAGEALECFHRCIDLAPDFSPAYVHAAVANHKLGRLKQGLAIGRRGLDFCEAEYKADLLCNLGSACWRLHLLDDAETYLRQAIEIEPEHADANWNLGIVLLAKGNFAEGWDGYQYGFKTRQRAGIRPYHDEFDTWNGETGANVLVWGEQGIGDEITFANCLPDLIRDSKHVIFDCHPRLESVWRRSFPEAEVHGWRKFKKPELFDNHEVDFHVPIGTLPSFYRRSLDSFPSSGGYMKADPERVQAWRDRIGGDVRIGISWRGGSLQTDQAKRSMDLSQMLGIMKDYAGRVEGCPSIKWVSLQYTPGAFEEIERQRALHGTEVFHFDGALENFEENINLTASCDLVISVITAAVHVAGALDIETWCMVPFAPPWKFTKTDTLPWHPSVKQYHQSQEYHWGDVTNRIEVDLSGWLQRRARVAA